MLLSSLLWAAPSGGTALLSNNLSASVKWRRGGEKSLDFSIVEFFASHPPAIVRVLFVPLVDVDPSRLDHLPSRLLRNPSWYRFPYRIPSRIFHLQLSGRNDLQRVELRGADRPMLQTGRLLINAFNIPMH